MGTVALGDEVAVHDAITWYEVLIGEGGEGMVIKPRDFVAGGKKDLVQPALKVRGREYPTHHL
jgi:protein phosphatase